MQPVTVPVPASLFEAAGYEKLKLLRTVPVGGGSINRCYRLETNAGFFFLKVNEAKKFPGMFDAEAKGLSLLKESSSFIVPQALARVEERGESFLLLEWMERGSPGKSSWFEAGVLLARLHRVHDQQFGLGNDNYIGSLPQSNRPQSSWEEFYAIERILPQVKRARDGGKMDSSLSSRAEKFCSRIGEIFPDEPPSLLHGDLWSGNFFFATGGPSVFDPAVYFGHREMDLAMTKLFGGFNADFYSGYCSEFAPERKWESRTGYCQLYPLLVHVNLFGGGYLYDVKSILSAF
jgi:fructosamine-3-kinase